MAKPISIIPFIRGSIVPSNLKVAAVTVTAGATTGTASVKAGSTVTGIYPTGNQDQFVSNVAISSTTLTVTLKAAATANNTFNVTYLESL